MDRLLKKCDGLYHQMEYIQTYLRKIYSLEVADPAKVSKKQLELKRTAADMYRDKYEIAYEELCELAENETLKKVYESHWQFEDMYSDIVNMIEKISQTLFSDVKSEPAKSGTSDVVDLMRELVNSQRVSTQELLNSQRESTQELLISVKELVAAKHTKTKDPIQANLPKLDLKSFSGGYTEWREFYDTFRCAVHDRDSLAPVQKLQYLKSCLKGEAADLVKSLTLEDRNYELALRQLKSRYDNVKTIRDAHFSNIFNLYQLNRQSAAGIRKVCCKMNENVQALRNLEEPTQYWDSWLVYVLKNRLDPETRMEWERKVSSTDNPKFEEMIAFLNEFATAIESSEQGKGKRPSDSKTSFYAQQDSGTNMNSTQTGVECFLCKAAHRLPQCSQFLSMTPEQRKTKVNELRLCNNCFSRQHFVASCVRPPSCKHCGGKHHPTLHFMRSSDNSGQSVKATAHVSYNSQEILLSTALVRVQTASGKLICRVLVDPGSQTSFVNASFVQRAQLKKRRTKESVQVCGIGGVAVKGKLDHSVVCDLRSIHDHKLSINVEAHVMDKVTGNLPRCKVNICDWAELKSIESCLADPQYDTPGPVDMLLGADIIPQILSCEMMKSPDGNLIAQKTLFGWVLCGKATVQSPALESVCSHFVTMDAGTEDILKRFWEVETVEQVCAWTNEEKRCEEHFIQTFSRDPNNGRYVVSLPFKGECVLGESRSKAEIRLKQTERKLARDKSMMDKYNEVVEEYFELGHAEVVPDNELGVNAYYMPHHGVIKESSSTTKLRVVFDASAKTSNGLSLNDCLMVGPKIQDDLFDILLRFRTHPIAMSADITKMYRQVKLSDTDKDYHRFLWRKSPQEEIRDYRMSAVTFGVASSPFHAQRVLKQVAVDYGEEYPLAASVVDSDFYMDDLIYGVESVTSGIRLRHELTDMLESAGFQLRKWSSSDHAVLEDVPLSEREIQETLDMDYDKAITKTLGIYWNPASDMFLYKVNLQSSDSCTVTKRQLLSESARIFDPLGLITPTTMIAKTMFQSLWVLGLNWDDYLPSDILKCWLAWKSEMTEIDNLQYERCLVPKQVNISDMQLHGFGDASETGYSACIYLRSVSEDKVTVKLVCAKTKVAPVKTVTLPRLELCAALLVARLLDKTRTAMKLTGVSLHAWSDSTVTLDWIRGKPNQWKTFVANRVSEIQDHMNPSQWRYCPSAENPADCASRGISPKQLVDHKLWWHGPTWLFESSEHWPKPHRNSDRIELQKEMRKTCVPEHMSHVVELKPGPNMDMFPYSTLYKIVRVSAWCFRWLHIHRSREKPQAFLTCREWNHALTFWIKIAQNEHFLEDIKRLKSNDGLLSKSRLLSLNPFVDESGLLRVGGRLGLSKLPYKKRHPVLLPRKHKLTRLIIEFEHRINLHALPQALEAAIRQRYWIIGGRDQIRYIIHKCVLCRKRRAEMMNQFMGMLPVERVIPSKVFQNTGVDYAGPLQIKLRPRGPTQKCWIALFVCFAVKAIHLELVSSASTPAFLAAFRRFIARRGKPHDMYSDNGSNFLGANRELRELKQLLDSEKHNELVATALAQDNIDWHYTPASAPHFGGLWEAGVKSVKQHLKSVVGGTALTFEELTTVLCQIEACLNSRPLCPMSTDPSDLQVLTPGHFLIGTELNSLPEPNLTEVKVNRLNRWQHLQLLHQHFWNRWSNEYLTRLQQRPKWTKSRKNLELGDLVLIKEENVPPMKWCTGRVIDLHPGKDKLVRVVTLKTASGDLKRPVVKLSLILGSDEMDTC